jgi:hypothetical protein
MVHRQWVLISYDRSSKKNFHLEEKGWKCCIWRLLIYQILGKGTVNLGSENVKARKVLLVDVLKHNLLSVSKICDQGYTLTFDSRKCKLRENNLGRLVATTTR